jgi:ferric-dicitrate binding protein FerR (iron transport regulator)
LQAVPSADEVDEIVQLFAKEASVAPPRAESPKGSRRVVAMTAGAVLMAAAAGLVFWLKSLDGAVPGPLSPSAVAPGAHSLLIGRYAADTCGDAGAGVVLCVLARSELAELELSPPRRLVRLTRGTAVASVASQPADTSFSLVTERAHVTSAGATFSVDVGEQGETAVRVHEGTVQVRAAGSTTATVLGEGQAFVLGAEKIQTVSTHERERDLRLLSDAKADAP